jgi:alpha-galactosidase
VHTFIRNNILPHGSEDRQVLYNSWEATHFAVDEQSQMDLARQAAEIGVELFVVDDGWFHRRSLDNAGLGDWWPDAGKFPSGLGKLIGYVVQLGMGFGLWIEPEMVNPDSELYRRNPDWVIHFPNRERSEARNQLILNVARPDVQEHLLETISTLLRDNNIRFIKWDMNRNVSEPGWQDAPGDPRELYIRYVQGLYRIWSELRRRFPHVIWESCSSGGGRADLGILRHADQVWVSDNTEPTARLRIQEGYSCCFPARTMSSWVTNSGDDRTSLEFRFHVSMSGVLAIGANLSKWNGEEKRKAAELIKQYKSIRPIVQNGEQYWLRSPHESPFSALMYMDKEQREGVLFAFRVHLPDPAHVPPLLLKGLDENGLYEIEGEGRQRSGRAWMEVGLQLHLGDSQSALKRIVRVDSLEQG